MEFGPRSLASRVVLCGARPARAARDLLAACQHVEPFLPVRVALPEEALGRYVVASPSEAVLARRAQVLLPATDALREAAPSAVLPDGRVWPQVVCDSEWPRLARWLTEQGRRDGAPLLLLSDFRLRGAPIVGRESDAEEAFRRTTLSALLIGDRILERSAPSEDGQRLQRAGDERR